MKFSPMLLLSLLSVSVAASPLAEPAPNAIADPVAAPVADAEPEPVHLEARDRWCWLKDAYNSAPCKVGAGTAYDNRRTIWYNGPNSGVSCKAYDTRQSTWLKIPGWNCWLQAKYANSACAPNVPWC